jgi:hypothetical protein
MNPKSSKRAEANIFSGRVIIHQEGRALQAQEQHGDSLPIKWVNWEDKFFEKYHKFSTLRFCGTSG